MKRDPYWSFHRPQGGRYLRRYLQARLRSLVNRILIRKVTYSKNAVTIWLRGGFPLCLPFEPDSDKW